MNAAVDFFLNLLYPPKCVLCGKLLEKKDHDLCPACRQSLPTAGEGNEMSVRGAERVLSALFYEGNVRQSFHRYKFAGRSCYAAAYGRLLAQTLPEPDCDTVSWVPLHPKRRRQRGYDQAELLARAYCEAVRFPEPKQLLVKIKNTAAQSGTGRATERAANIAGAYRSLNPAEISGKRILLIDDVITTGSTFSEAARTLRGAGALSVTGLTLARRRDE